MSKLRSVSTAFWSDPFIEDLTPSQKLLFLYLITNDKTNMLGIYEASIKKISNETDIPKIDVKKGLDLLEVKGKVKYINNYVVLVNYMKHQNFNTNMKKSAIDIYNKLPKALKHSDIIVDKSNPLEGFETLLNHYGMVPKVEVETESETELEVKEEKMYPKEVHDCFNNCLTYFPIHLHPKGGNNKNNWLDTIQKLSRIDKIPFELIEQIVKRTRENNFWSKHFISITKLRKKNPEGIMYIIVFNEQTKNQQNETTTKKSRYEKVLEHNMETARQLAADKERNS